MILQQDLSYKQKIYEDSVGRNVSIYKIFLSDGTSAVILYRTMRWFESHNLKLFAYFFQYLNKLLNHCVIGISADFDEGFVLLHPTGVIINSSVKGGKNIAIESGVVIGEEKSGFPELGDNIFVGSGAKIIGDLTIGNNVKVGANAVVVKSIPNDVTVVGVPARVLRAAKEK